MDIETRLDEFVRVVEFQCPAEFWPALGYEGEARYVAIWWERGGDEASWSDGRDVVIGADWMAYQVLLGHNVQLLRGWLLGSSEHAAEYYLVIDRERERAWLLPPEEAPQVLQLQWTPQELAFDYLGKVRRAAARVQLLTWGYSSMMARFQERIAESQRRNEVLLAALEKRRPGWTERPWW